MRRRMAGVLDSQLEGRGQQTVFSPVLRIEPPKGWKSTNWSEMWRFRELFFYLVWRELRILFTNTALGILWIVISPLSTVLVLAVVLGVLVRVPTGKIPYSLMLLSGLVPWLYFSNSVTKACHSILGNAYLLTKVYFPRLLVPAVPIVASLVDFVILLIVLLVLSIVFGIKPAVNWLFLFVPTIITVGLSLGTGLGLSALNVKFRDVGSMLPIALQIFMYASPLFYPLSIVPERFRGIYSLNPFVGIFEGMRWGLFPQERFPFAPLAVSATAAVLTLAVGALIFKKIEDSITDIV